MGVLVGREVVVFFCERERSKERKSSRVKGRRTLTLEIVYVM